MIGLDTNVIVRYLAQDDEKQSRIATQLIEKKLSVEEPGFVSLIVLCEVCWVLKRSYKIDKASLVKIVDALLTTQQLHIEDVEVAWKALRAYEESRADFSDAVIVLNNLKYGCAETVTFDSKASKVRGTKLLE